MTFDKSKDKYRDRVTETTYPEQQIKGNIPYNNMVKRWNKKRKQHFAHKQHRGTKLIKR